MRVCFAIALILILCRCATQHQPQVFAPYFAFQPETKFSPKHVYEIRDFEGRESLSQLQKKRLSDLYTLEYSTTRSEPRKVFLKAQLDRLHPDVIGAEEEVRMVSEKNRKKSQPAKKDEEALSDPEIKMRFMEAQSLWNKDLNAEAVEALLPLREAPLSDAGMLKVEYLFFRIQLEQGDLPTATESYEKIRSINKCGFEATQAALLLSLRNFGDGNSDEAYRTFSKQCDDEAATVNRRDYWLARFTKDEEERKLRLLKLAQKQYPDYYTLMARTLSSVPLERPEPATAQRPYLAEMLSVSGEMHRLLSKAEECLANNLKRDASVYLTRVSQILRDDNDSDDLWVSLYAASLFEAAGNHLEAMKIYNWLPGIVPEKARDLLSNPDLVREMFPTPFQAKVEWLAQTWQVDPDLVFSLMRQESAFNPAAVSSADARGLMQLMPFLAKFLAKRWKYEEYYHPKHLLNAEENLKLAIFHLHQLQELVPHIALMAASYNAGVQRTTNWWKKFGQYPLDVFTELIPILETRNYVKYVLRNFCYYKAQRLGKVDLANQFSMALPAIPGGVPIEEVEKESPQGNP
ncbi:MAG: lytic transglycosylase domain-containing protein [Deltaproteobacteria bacterium]|nr:lytic transglycosylase domain-containing protein [Deltaproteobacteria bacterium]MBI3296488.1 lytic transglycosylase domain-containing protein [Deltaproteobacteria bacterium]